jgi:hypothetical protein
MSAKEILQRFIELTKHQANLKAGQEATLREKWQQADYMRQDLLQQLAKANRKRVGQAETTTCQIRKIFQHGKHCEGLRVALDSAR